MPFHHVDEDPGRKFIRGGQVVRLQHTELGGFLAADGSDFSSDGLGEVFVRNYDGNKDDVEANCSGALFEIERDDNYNRGAVLTWSSKKDSSDP